MKNEEKAKTAMPSFDLLKLVKVCLKSWRLFAVSIIVCTGLAAVFAYLKLPSYQVDAQLMLKDEAGGGGMMMYGDIARSFALGDMLGMGSSTDNEVAVMQSHTVFLETVRDLSLNVSYEEKVKFVKWAALYNKSPFKLQTPPLLGDTLGVSLLIKMNRRDDDRFDITFRVRKTDLLSLDAQTLPCTLQTPYGEFTISPTEYLATDKARSFRIGICSYDAAAESCAKLVTVFAPNRKTDFIALSVVTGDPEFGKTLLDTVIQNYNDLGNDEKRVRNNSTLRLVNDRLNTLTAEMAETEQRLEDFKRQNQITEVEYDAQFILNKKSGLETALLKAQTEAEILRMTLDFVKDETNAYELVPDLLTSGAALTSGAETARTQIAGYNELILERMRMAASARENNTALRQLDQQIAALRSNIVVSVQRAYDNARVELSKVQAENDRTGGRISSLPALERQYLEIRRISELQNQMYLFLLQQKEEISLNLASRTISAVTIDSPHVLVEPVGLSKTKILILGFLLGGLLALALVYFLRLRREPFSSVADIKDASEAPVLAAFGRDDSATLAVLSDGPDAEAYRRLRSDLLLLLKEADGNTVLVTSPARGDGKTTVAVNLAVAMAMAGKRTLLIDGDMRHPAVASMLGIDAPVAALARYAAGDTDLDVRSVSAGAATLSVVTAASGSGSHPADVMASDRAVELLHDLQKQYDIIVVDSSPLRGHSDAYDWAPLCDATVVVLRAGVSNVDDATLVNGLLADARLPRIAVVANAVK